MKHALSDAEIDWRTRPFSHTGEFWGGATVACVVVPYYLWQMGSAATLGLIPWLMAAIAVALMVVFIRRFLRPPRAELQQTFIEFTPGGIWQVGPNSRVLLMAAPEVQRAEVFRTMNQIHRIVVCAPGRKSVKLPGLQDMEAALADLRATFRTCVVTER